MPGPLDGITVIEACQMVSGPLAGMVLADWGADVVKVEQPAGGDRMRVNGTRRGGMAAYFANVNRGKRCLVVDLQQPEGLEVVQRLASTADVFLQNFRPGVAERLGIGASALRSLNDRLIYVSISGFGDDGPYADQKVYDYVVQAMSGMAGLQADVITGEPALVNNIVLDKVTAYTVAHAVTAALFARERGQGGQHIEINMLDTALAFVWPDGMMNDTLLGDGVKVIPHQRTYYRAQRTADGAIAHMAISDRQFPALCRALGTEHLLADERFSSMDRRISNMAELRPILDAEFAKWPAEQILKRMHEEDAAAARIAEVGEVHLDPQVIHNETLVEHDRPHIGRVREPRPVPRFSATPASLGRHAPALDEHTDEILAELGYSPDEIADRRTRGTIGARH